MNRKEMKEIIICAGPINSGPGLPPNGQWAKTENPLPFFLSGSHETNFDALY